LQRKIVTLVMSAMLVTGILALMMSLRRAQASGTTLYVDPAVSTMTTDESFTVNVNIENVVDLFSYETKLSYDSSILEPVTIQEGPFIKDQTTSPSGTFFLSIIEDGFVHVACLTMGNYPGVSGSGNLFNVTFNVVRAGTSLLHLYDSILDDSSIVHIPHDTTDGTVHVTLSGDVNGDGIVNVIDLTIVSLAYGLFRGEPGYNPEADLNEDGVVDMQDLVIVAYHLGET